MYVSVQSIENDMVEQVRRFDALNECGQQIVSVVDNQEAIGRISTLLEEFQERWEKLVQDMESQSKEVGGVNTCLSSTTYHHTIIRNMPSYHFTNILLYNHTIIPSFNRALHG